MRCHFKLGLHDFETKCNLHNVWATFKNQFLGLMYNIYHYVVRIPYFSVIINDAVHTHNSRQSHNLHIDYLSTIDKHNFLYYCRLYWNASLVEYRFAV